MFLIFFFASDQIFKTTNNEKHTQIKDIHWDIYVTRANTNLSKLKSSLQQIYFDKRHINKAMLK